MTIKDLCKAKEVSIDVCEFYANKLCLANEKELNKIIEEANKAIKNLLELKQIFKKLNCNLPEDCNLLDYTIWMETGVASYEEVIKFKVSPHYKCCLYFNINLSISLEELRRESEAGIKKFKALYKLAQYFKIEQDKKSKLKSTYEDLIYTINRLVEFIKFAKKDAEENLKILNKEIC